MKSKTPLMLMEQLVMILVFALAAALCLQVFAASHRISRENEMRSQAAFLAQNAAETVKACRGDYEEVKRRLGGKTSGDGQTISYDQTAYCLEIRAGDPPETGLGQARIYVFSEDGEELISLPVAWEVE